MKKVGTFLCGITAAVLMTGCGSVMPELTEEETEVISEYAAGVLLKYDKVYSGRLMNESEYEEEKSKRAEQEAAEAVKAEEEEQKAPAEETEAETADDTEVVDISQDGGESAVPSTIEEYYEIPDITFTYNGYELAQSYPSDPAGDGMFFAMDATDGMQLLVLKFMASNESTADVTLDMLAAGARFKVSVNGDTRENALSTMLLNDLQAYKGVVPSGSGVELVSIIEVPQEVTVETIDFILCGDQGNSTINLQ